MKTIKIRELRGSALEHYSRSGELVGVTRAGGLIAVIVPVRQEWIEHMVDHNWSQVLRSAAAAEGGLAAEGTALVTLDGVLWRSSQSTLESDRQGGQTSPPPSEGTVNELQQSHGGRSGRTLDQGLPGVVIDRLQEILGLKSEAASGGDSTVTVRIGDLSAARIDQACNERQLLALTNDGALLGIVIPVSPKTVEFLVAQNLSRVIYNIQRAEREVEAEVSFKTVEDTLDGVSTRAEEERLDAAGGDACGVKARAAD